MELNVVHILGNLTRDPETRHLASGTSVTTFSLACNRRYTVNGEKREEVLFIDVTAWAKTGEFVQKYMQKGSSCLVHGYLKQEIWDDKQTGAKRSKIVLVADRVGFGVPSRKEGEGGAAPTRSEARPAGQQGDLPENFGEGDPTAGNDDLPF